MSFLGGLIKTVAGVATKIIPGPIDDIIVDQISGALGGSGQVSNRSKTQAISKVATSPIARTSASLPQLPALQPVGMQQKDPITVTGSTSINLPGLGPKGAGISASFGVNQATTPSGKTRATGGASIPMLGPIGVSPDVENIPTRKCPTGYVLAIDGLCYPKQMVPKAWRFWKPQPRPVVTRSDQKAIQKANSAKKRLVNLTKKAGAHASMTKPRRSSGRKGSC